MTLVNIIILSTLALLTLVGFKSGLLIPVSGIGGLAIGVLLAAHHHGALAFLLTDQIQEEEFRRIAAFGIIVLATVVAARISAGVIRKLLKQLGLGWVDHAAGAVAGGALGVVALGTLLYLMAGADLGEVSTALSESQLAGTISEASLISVSDPWCHEVGQAGLQGCTELSQLTDELLGITIPDKLSELLGQDVGELKQVVGASLTGSAQDLTQLVSSEQ